MKRKQLNIKFLAALFLGGLFVVGAVHWLNGKQLSRNANSLLSRADEARKLAEENAAESDIQWEKAVRLRRRYLAFRQRDEAQWMELLDDVVKRFDSLVKNGNLTPEVAGVTLRFMDSITTRWPNNPEVRLKASDFYVTFGNTQKALDHFKAWQYLAESGTNPDTGEPIDVPPLDAKRTVNLAYCLLDRGDKEYENRKGVPGTPDEQVKDGEMMSAEAYLIEIVGLDPINRQFDKSKAKAPDTVNAYNLLMQIYRARKEADLELAQMVMNQLVEVNDTAEAYMARARSWQYTLKDESQILAKLREDVAKAEEKDANSQDVMLTRVQLAIRDNDLIQAEEILKVALEKFPDAPVVYSLLTKLAINRQEVDRAEEILDQGLKKLKDNQLLLWDRANLYLEQRNLQKFTQVFKRLQLIKVRSELLDLLRAKEALANDEPVKAMEIVERIRPMLDGMYAAEARNVLITCYKKANRNDKVQEMLVASSSSRTTMQNLSSLMELAEQLLRSGKYTEAIELLNRALVDLQKQDNTRGAVLQVQRVMLAAYVQEQTALPEDQRNWTNVDALMQAVMKDDSLEPSKKAAIQLQVLLDQGRTEDAEKMARLSQQQFPEEPAFWLARMRLSKSAAEQEELLDQMKTATGNSETYRLMRAEHIARTTRDLGAIAQVLQDVDSLTPEARDRLYKGIGQLYFQLGALSDAQTLWEEQSKIRPNDANIQLMLFDLAKESENEASMKERIDNLRRITGPNGDEFRIARATYLWWKMRTGSVTPEQMTEARDLAAAIRQGRPKWPIIYQLEGELNLLENKIELAIESFQTARELDPNNPMIVRRLALLLSQSGRVSEAEQLVQGVSLTARQAINPDEQVRILEASGDIKAALKAAEAFAESTDPRQLGVYGRLLTRNGQLDKAEEILKKAVAQAAELPENWISLVEVGIEKKNKQLIESTVQQAQLHIPAWQLPQFMGDTFFKQSKYEEANSEYEIALVSNPQNSAVLLRAARLALATKNSKRATELLQQILKHTDVSDVEDVRNARRDLARIWAAADSGEPFSKVIELFETQVATVDDVAQSSSSSAASTSELAGEDLFLYVNLCASRPEYSYRELAVKTLEQRRGRLGKDEQFLLASLYNNLNRWNNARDLMLDLLTTNPRELDVKVVTAWVDWVISHDDKQELTRWQQLIGQMVSMANSDRDAIKENFLKEAGEAKGRGADLDPVRKAELTAQFNAANERAEILHDLQVRSQAYLLVRNGKSLDAAKQLSALIPKELPKEKAPKLLMVARWMEALAKHDPRFYQAAEGAMERYIKAEQEVKAPTTRWFDLARIKSKRADRQPEKVASAIADCEKNFAANPSLAVEVAVDALRVHRNNLDQDGYQDLVAKVQKMLQQAPDSPEVFYQRALFADAQGNVKEAEKQYRLYLNLPDVIHVRTLIVKNNLAFILALQGRGDEAARFIQDAAQTFGESPELLDTRAVVRIAEKKYEEAIADLRQAIAKGGETPEKLLHLAQAQLLLGQADEATQSLQRSFDVGLNPVTELNVLELKQLEQLKKELKVSGPTKNVNS